jgi:two-component system, NarL family, sensor histidine kinase DesK
VTLQDGVVVCHIRDDGKKLDSLQALEQGNGLRGMQERVTSLGGQLRVEVARGLSLELRLPTGSTA